MNKIVQFIFLLILCCIPVCVLIAMGTYCLGYPDLYSFKEIIWTICGIFISIFLFKKLHVVIEHLSIKRIVIIGIGILNFFMFVVLFSFNTQPCSDYEVIWDIANKMAIGEFNINDYPTSSYIYVYNWQLGISALESIFIRWFGPHFSILKIVNLIIINLTALTCFVISKRITSISASKFSLLLFCTYYPIIITVGQFTNQHLAALLILSILYLLVQKKWVYYIIAGIMTAILNVIRPMGILILLSVICMLVYYLIRKTDIKKNMLRTIAFFVSYFLILSAFDKLFIELEYADSAISQPKIGYFKFDKGLTGYNAPNLIPFDGNVEAFNEWEKEKLINLITEKPKEIVIYVVKKMNLYLGLFDYKFENTYNHDMSIWAQYPIKAFYSFGWGQYIFLIVFAIIGYNKWRKNHDVDIFQVFYIGNTLVYLFIEAFSAYRYESYPILIMFAGYGLYHYNKSSKNFIHRSN